MFPFADGITSAIRTGFARLLARCQWPAVALAYVHPETQSRPRMSRRGAQSGPRRPTDGVNYRR